MISVVTRAKPSHTPLTRAQPTHRQPPTDSDSRFITNHNAKATNTTSRPALADRGDDEPFTVTFRDPATGDPLDITDWTASLTIAEQRADGTVVIEKDNTTHTDATGGTTSFDLTSDETSGLAGTYRYDIQVKKSDGSIKTAVIGTIAFTDGVTDREV